MTKGVNVARKARSAMALLWLDAPLNILRSYVNADLNYQPLVQGLAMVLVSASRVVGLRVTQITTQRMLKTLYLMNNPTNTTVPSTYGRSRRSLLTRPKIASDCCSHHSELCSHIQHTAASAFYPSELLKVVGWVPIVSLYKLK